MKSQSVYIAVALAATSFANVTSEALITNYSHEVNIEEVLESPLKI